MPPNFGYIYYVYYLRNADLDLKNSHDILTIGQINQLR